ncbi:MAG: hypothetical protein JJU11_05855 [Candidatus Sumerlaeia bacterium]|nr:hypothetical protein [Candidatus Sumerlaeia bacterium]
MEPEERKTTEIKLDLDGGSSSDDWADLLAEMEKAPAKPKAKPKAPSQEPPAPKPAQPAKPSDYFTKALSELEEARDVLGVFVKSHPYLVAPNIYKMWDESIKECSITMQRQIDRLDGLSPGEDLK